jgi:hypothetical protein
MLPKIIIHNSISTDGSLTNFEPHMGLHYQKDKGLRSFIQNERERWEKGNKIFCVHIKEYYGLR